MRIIGIDYGSKRVGVAVSDEAAKFALPLSVLASSPVLVPEIDAIARQHAATEIVIGESRAYDMSPNKILPHVLELKRELEGKGYAVHLELEFMTSHQAARTRHELGGKTGGEDASAAALILQSFLDRRNP